MASWCKLATTSMWSQHATYHDGGAGAEDNDCFYVRYSQGTRIGVDSQAEANNVQNVRFHFGSFEAINIDHTAEFHPEYSDCTEEKLSHRNRRM